MKQKQEQERQDGVVENVAVVLLEYDGTGSDQELISALDKKYDALKDKLLLEALKKQLGNATFTLGNTDWDGFLNWRSGEVENIPSAPNRSQNARNLS